MTSSRSEPSAADGPGGGAAAGPGQPAGPVRARRWPWWLLAVLLVGGALLIAAQPWANDGQAAPPLPVPTTPATTSPTTGPSAPAPTPSARPTATPPVFDESTMSALFLTADDIVDGVPDASGGVTAGIGTGELPWGLPEGSSVDPASCTTAVTVVAQAPAAFDARSWSNDLVDVQQRVTVLVDPGAAREAFRELVATVDACPEYTQVNPGMDGSTWTAEPALEALGRFPSLAQETVQTGEGRQTAQLHGHMLVGNAIVTWTASALTSDGSPSALDGIGTPASLDALVQARAEQAVQSLP
ncbi:hypothetical protein AGMMS50218_14070 [Actinomycetota bacterium]|nr:hypothetical protein AGMMS50218_14070 [Actinomycetota bacterium]